MFAQDSDAPGGPAPLDEIPLEELEDQIVGLAAEVYALTCRWLCLVAEFERRGAYADWGCSTCAQWLAWRCGLSDRAARDHVRVARRLPELPLIRARFASGELSYSKVRALTRVATAQDEAELLEMAEHATTGQLERIARVYRGALDLNQAEEAHRDRFLAWSWEPDGSLSFRGQLPGEEAALFLRALEAGRDSLYEEANAEDGHSEPPERVSNADAVVSMAETMLASGPASRRGGERSQVVVHADADVLSKEAESGRCTTADGSPLAAETARRLACDAAVVPIFERDGKALSVGRRSRSIPPSIRRVLDARDGGCRFPGSVKRIGDRFVFRRPDGKLIADVPCMRRRGQPAQSRRLRGDRHPATLRTPARERLDLDHAIFALLAQPGPRERARGPDPP